MGSADYLLVHLTFDSEATYLLNSNGREDTLKHGTHKPELRQLRTISLLLEPIEHELYISYTPVAGLVAYKGRIPELSSRSKSNVPQCRSNEIPTISSISPLID